MKRVSAEIKTGTFLLILTTFCTGLLGIGNSFYQKALAENQKEVRMDILRAFDIPFTEETFFSVFSESIKIHEGSKSTYYLSRDHPLQMAIITSGSGLWSVIELYFVVDLEEQVLRELRVLSHAETPGVGSRIEEQWFLDQFSNLDISDGVKAVTTRTGASGEVDVITGATYTSTSVEKIINAALESYRR